MAEPEEMLGFYASAGGGGGAVDSVAGRTGDVVLTKSDVGLSNVDNTTDAGKPVSTAQATADNLRVLKAGDTMSGDLSMGSAVKIVWASDTNLYRSAADTLTTDDRLSVLRTASGASLYIDNRDANGSILSTATAVGSSGYLLGSAVVGDTTSRFVVRPSGQLEWGTGLAACDTILYRSAADTLKTDDSFHLGGVGAALKFTSTNPGGIIAEDLDVSSSGNVLLYTKVTGEANRRFQLRNSGRMDWGAGGATAMDTNLYRSAADLLRTDDAFIVSTSQANVWAHTVTNTSATGHGVAVSVGAAAGNCFGATVSGDAFYRYFIDGSGKVTWGSGAVAGDTNLYRGGVDLLKTDDSLEVGPAASYLKLNNNGTDPQIAAEGSSANHHLVLTPKGVGSVKVANSGILFGADTNLYRSAADTLKTDDAFSAAAAITAFDGGTKATQITNAGIKLVGSDTDQTMSLQAKGIGTVRINNAVGDGTGGLLVYSGGASPALRAQVGPSIAADLRPAAGSDGVRILKEGEAFHRIRLTDSGQILLSDGANAADTNLYRSAADNLKTDDMLWVAPSQAALFALTATNANATGNGLIARGGGTGTTAGSFGVVGDANARFAVLGSGRLEFGDGTAAADTNLYRSAANVLKTDDALSIAGNVGFYGTTPAAKPTVTGSRTDGTALTSLLTALATLGLITDSTTA